MSLKTVKRPSEDQDGEDVSPTKIIKIEVIPQYHGLGLVLNLV